MIEPLPTPLPLAPAARCSRPASAGRRPPVAHAVSASSSAWAPKIAALLALFGVLAFAPPTRAQEAGIEEPATSSERTRPENRAFRGLGFYTHLQLGAMYGQHAIRVSTYDAVSVATGDDASERALATGLGAATRLELWPAYGRYAGIGAYGAGHLGGLRRGGALTGTMGGSTGLVGAFGVPRVKLLLTLGRAWHGGAFTNDEAIAWDQLDLDSEVTAGAERVRSYRSGLGTRIAIDGSATRGVDLWLLFDEPTLARGSNAPFVAVPKVADSALIFRGTFWVQNAVTVGTELTLRAAPLATSASSRVLGRSALVTVSWSMDRFSRPYRGQE